VSLETSATAPVAVEVQKGRPAGHAYSCEVICDFLQFVLRAATSFRGASGCLDVVKQRLGLKHVPAPNTGENWLLRLGLFELTRPKERADDWAWLADHSLQIGPHKCLVIVGVRMSAWEQQRRPLQHQDLSILKLKLLLTCDGLTAAQEFEDTAAVHGEPREIVIDGGADLTKGAALFQERHARTARVGDIAHKAALIVKRELEGDSRWQHFLSKLGRSSQRAARTSLACLRAPAPRLQARYMNAYEQVHWGMRMQKCLESPHRLDELHLNAGAFEEKYGWLREYREALEQWDEMMHAVGTTLEYIRVEGYHLHAASQLRMRLGEMQGLPAARTSAALIEFVADQSKSAHSDERLIGSTEVLESLFGKLKRLEGQQNQGGFTKLVLGLAASVATLTHDYLRQALESITTKQVRQWCDQHLGTSLQAHRQRALGTKPG
jgi:hypothetical protein